MLLTVKVPELYQRVKEMYDDGMDFVEIMLSEADNSVPSMPLPPSISFIAWTEEEPFAGIDYEEVEGTASDN